MPSGVNGRGFGSKEEIMREYAEKYSARPSNLNYRHPSEWNQFMGTVTPSPLPPSPLDGNQMYEQARATEDAQTRAREAMLRGGYVSQPVIPPPQVVQPPRKKTLKELALERGHIPRRESQ